MPELPEVETIKQGMEKALLGKQIKSVQVNRYDLRVQIPQNFAQTVTGKLIQSLTRRGKYIIIQIDTALFIILHLGMSGRINIFLPNTHNKPKKHEHAVFIMEDGTYFSFEDPRRFGMLYVATGDWRREKYFINMGYEPLDNWTGQDLLKPLKNKKSPIKTALLDQRVVAGLGNIYVCEILFRSFINPMRSSNSITKGEADKIVLSSRKVLDDAIKAGGSTLKDYKHTDGSLGYFQHSFSVYDREGQNCSNKNCTSSILRIVQAGRSTFYCPSCQK